MLKDIEDGKINMSITKDLSRLGRVTYTHAIIKNNIFHFIMLDIAINDGIDTLIDNNDIAPFKNIQS